MRVVIDTNVPVSAIIRDRKLETVILFVVSNPDIGWIGYQEKVMKELSGLSSAGGSFSERFGY